MRTIALAIQIFEQARQKNPCCHGTYMLWKEASQEKKLKYTLFKRVASAQGTNKAGKRK
jgi:hypothetical protein